MEPLSPLLVPAGRAAVRRSCPQPFLHGGCMGIRLVVVALLLEVHNLQVLVVD